MARPKKSRQLSPLVIPLVAGGLTLLLAGIVVFFSLSAPREIPIPGPTVTISAPTTVPPSGSPVTPESARPEVGVTTGPDGIPPRQDPEAPPAVPQGPQAPPPSAPQPVAPVPQPQAPPADPAPAVDLPKIIDGVLCSLFCPL